MYVNVRGVSVRNKVNVSKLIWKFSSVAVAVWTVQQQQ